PLKNHPSRRTFPERRRFFRCDRKSVGAPNQTAFEHRLMRLPCGFLQPHIESLVDGEGFEPS
ncbi:MAG TPA: hypothetical protein VGR03_04445, partial [Candidatus Acidoferrum sp.]|nr:hypothetical protein [Candidatus Acidoferrum sp.]